MSRRRILRVTPFDFVRSSGYLIGNLNIGEALGYFRWLALNIEPEHQRSLNHGSELHPYRHPLVPIDDDMRQWLRHRLRYLVAPTYGHVDEPWRRRVHVHADDLLIEHRLPVHHWDAHRPDHHGLDRLRATTLPFAPNQFHRDARLVTHASAMPTPKGWLIRLSYDDRRAERRTSSWTLDYEIRDSRASLWAGMELIADHLLERGRAKANQAWFQALDYPEPILIPSAATEGAP